MASNGLQVIFFHKTIPTSASPKRGTVAAGYHSAASLNHSTDSMQGKKHVLIKHSSRNFPLSFQCSIIHGLPRTREHHLHPVPKSQASKPFSLDSGHYQPRCATPTLPIFPGAIIHAGAKNRNAVGHLPVPAFESTKKSRPSDGDCLAEQRLNRITRQAHRSESP